MMGKLYDDYIAKPRLKNGMLRPSDMAENVEYVPRAEFEALRAKVTEMEKRYQPVTKVTPPVTAPVTKRNALTPAEKQRAYRERKKHGQAG